MKTNFAVVELLSVLFVLSVVFPASAHAYIDPSTGSYVIQLLFGTFFGAYVSLKMAWRSIRAYVQQK